MSEETVVQEPKTEPKQENNELQAIMEKLNEVGITSVEQLENKVTAASESGRLANIVGSLRKEIAELKNVKPEPRTEYNEDGIDIESIISGAVKRALGEEKAEQAKVRTARVREAQSIRSDKNYPVVAEKFEKFMITPQARGMLDNGYTPTKIFNDMVIGEYRNMAMTMKTAIEGTTGDPSKTLVPHMEDGQTAPPRVTQADEKKGKIKSIRENWSGDDEDINRALKALLPSGTIPMPNR
uniref:Uncharacterized protein n=1 Tax=viral metagenome TaxID=1070528 RepID=A0A6M3J2B5_9ZZZZ